MNNDDIVLLMHYTVKNLSKTMGIKYMIYEKGEGVFINLEIRF